MTMLSGAVSTVLADDGTWGGHHMDGWGSAVFGWLFMALIVILLAWLIITSTWSRGASSPAPNTALDTLDQRYARGEIDRDEYLERRADLQG